MLKSTTGTSRQLRWHPLLWLIYVVALVASATIVFPVGRMLLGIFVSRHGVDFSGLSEAAVLPGIGTTLVNTAIVVAVSVTIALIVGTVFAWLNERTDARLGWVAGVLPVVPLLAPPITIAIGWVFMLSPRVGFLNVAIRWILGIDNGAGPFNIFSWYGLIGLYAVELIPVVYLVVSAALRNMDPMLEQASRMYGAGPFKTFMRVTIPSIRGALASAAWLATTVALALFSAPSIVGRSAGIDVLTARIVRLLTAQYPPRTDVAVVLGGFILLIIAIGWVIQRRIVASGRYSVIGGKSSNDSKVRLGIWRLPSRICMITFLAGAVFLPITGLLLVSLQPFWTPHITLGNLSLHAYWSALAGYGPTGLALWNSVRLATVCATTVIFVAFCVTSLGHWLQPGKVASAFDGILKLPAGFSHVIVAISVLLVFFAEPFNLSGTLLILGIAYVTIYMPQGSIAANSAIGQVDLQLLEASQMSGAHPARTGWRILLPLTMGGLASGWVLVFVYIIGDLTASVLLSGTTTPTVGYVLLQEFNNGSYPVIAALGMVVCVTSSIVVLSVLRLTASRRS